MNTSDNELAGNKLYRLLKAELCQAGCFRPTLWTTLGYMAFVLTVFLACYVTLLLDPSAGIRVLALLILAFACVHAGFIGHEAGHNAVTRHRRIEAVVGQIFDTFLIGLCYSSYRRIHRQHHARCNEEAADPDIQSGVVSMYEDSARRMTGFAKLVARYQAYLIWVLVWLQGFKLKFDGFNGLWSNSKTTRIDQVVLVLHFALWLGIPIITLGFWNALLNYGLVTLFTGPYLGAVFLVNHIGTRVIRPSEDISFFHKQVATTRNLGTSRISDFLFGGLNNHLEHHLFPSIPTARLRIARRVTRSFCERHGLTYREMSWSSAARDVFTHFREMSGFVGK